VTDLPEARFPRGTALPTQSPMFWAQQKDRYLRQLLIRDIEAITNRRLVIYYANRFANAQIDQRDCLFFVELFSDINNAPVDLMIETNGGETDATEALVRLIQNLSVDIRVVVPNAAKSNGTLLCLAANTIVMSAQSELGPIEPSLQGIPASVLDQPQIANANFVLHKLGEFALQQTKDFAKHLLMTGMMSNIQERVEETVQILSSRERYRSHGSVIDHKEAIALGLNITYLDQDDELWKRLWFLYVMYQQDCERSQYLKIFEGRSKSTAVALPNGN
jgi:ClpP class serine protease